MKEPLSQNPGCNKCIHCHIGWGEYSVDECRQSYEIRCDPMQGGQRIYQECRHRNATCECQDFEPKPPSIWKRIWRSFRGYASQDI